MAQASELELNEKPVQSAKWTMRRLTKGLSSTVSMNKVFNTVTTVAGLCTVLLVVFIGIGLLAGKDVEIWVYFLAVIFGVLHLADKEIQLKHERFLLANKQKP